MIISVMDYVKDELDDAVSRARARFRASALPIYRSVDGVPEQLGTSFIIEVDGGLYLITAAHVLDHASDHALYLGSIGALRKLDGNFHVTVAPDGVRQRDHHDFAWQPIEDSFVRDLGVQIIRQDQISHNRINPAGRVYLAVGFPNSKNKKIDHKARTISPRRATYHSTHSLKPALLKKLGLSGDQHLVVEYKSRSLDEQRQVINSFQPRGMSGGPLFDLGKIVLKTSPEKALLSGMIIEHHKDHAAILSVKIDLIIESIRSRTSALLPQERNA